MQVIVVISIVVLGLVYVEAGPGPCRETAIQGCYKGRPYTKGYNSQTGRFEHSEESHGSVNPTQRNVNPIDGNVNPNSSLRPTSRPTIAFQGDILLRPGDEHHLFKPDPIDGIVNPTDRSVNPYHESVNPTDGSVNPSHESVNPTDGSVNPSHESVNPIDGNVNPNSSLRTTSRPCIETVTTGCYKGRPYTKGYNSQTGRFEHESVNPIDANVTPNSSLRHTSRPTIAFQGDILLRPGDAHHLFKPDLNKAVHGGREVHRQSGGHIRNKPIVQQTTQRPLSSYNFGFGKK